jgi:hypothetical protein
MGLMMLGRWKYITAEPLVPELSPLEVKIAVDKLEGYKSPGGDQIPAELSHAEGETLLSEIRKLIIVPRVRKNLRDQLK